jgi:hypothetical protein
MLFTQWFFNALAGWTRRNASRLNIELKSVALNLALVLMLP